MPANATFGLDDYHALHERFKVEVAGREIGGELQLKLREMIWEFLQEHSLPNEAVRVSAARRVRSPTGWSKEVARGCLVAILMGLTALITLSVSYVYLGDWYTLAFMLAAMMGTLVLIVNPGGFINARLRVVYAPVWVVTEALATLLDRDRPAHPLRWLGFWIFVYGFVLDLLAS